MKLAKNFGLGVGVGLLIGIPSLMITTSKVIYLSNIDPSVILWLATIIVVVVDTYLLLRKRIALAIGVIVGCFLPLICLAVLLSIGCLSSHVCA